MPGLMVSIYQFLFLHSYYIVSYDRASIPSIFGITKHTYFTGAPRCESAVGHVLFFFFGRGGAPRQLCLLPLYISPNGNALRGAHDGDGNGNANGDGNGNGNGNGYGDGDGDGNGDGDGDGDGIRKIEGLTSHKENRRLCFT